MLIYVDERGDLGWSFDQPYGQGGSSRYLTIAALLVPDLLDHLPKRKVKDLYKYGKWDTKREKKWVEMSSDARLTFARAAASMREKHPDISYKAIVVDKQNVNDNFRRDSNKLYNYMIRLLLVDEMAKHPFVTLVPDPRSIKVQYGNRLHHYLDAMLYEKEAVTTLEMVIRDSRDCLSLQFADMLAGVVGSNYEFRKCEPLRALGAHIQVKTLFFDIATRK
ncbi:MAG: DUF3800 domain-containing protein [Pseudomonadota bacterium]